MIKAGAVGWDIGGAHLKVARLDAGGAVEGVLQLPCPLWQGLDQLQRAMREALPLFGTAPLHAVTMTGEMVDYFPSRRAGVERLLQTLAEHLPGVRLRVFTSGQRFVTPHDAAGAPDTVASANWMASAAFVASRIEAGLFIDIGSTTTDLVPVAGGKVLARGTTDARRLVSGELVYTGVVRTPVMALAQSVPFDGELVPLMAEFFATAGDVYRVLGRLPEHADQHPAADGGEKTVEASARRLARMLGHDLADAPLESWQELARRLALAQRHRIEEACDRVRSRGEVPARGPWVGAGVGRFVAQELAAARGLEYFDFATLFPAGAASPEATSDCAPAVAVAALALTARD